MWLLFNLQSRPVSFLFFGSQAPESGLLSYNYVYIPSILLYDKTSIYKIISIYNNIS